MAGRGDPADLATVYPGYPSADLRMVRTGGEWEQLAEPCADGAWPPVGVGPAGMFAQTRSSQIGRPVCVVNCAIGGYKSSQWLPSEDPKSAYQKCLSRALAAITHEGAYLGGYLLYDGANDATEAMCNWAANWSVTLPSIQRWVGPAPVLYTRLPSTTPTDMAYPTWSVVRDQQDAWQAEGVRAMVQAPEGPWREAYKLHLTTAGSRVVADAFVVAAAQVTP